MIMKISSRRHRPSGRGSPPQAHDEEDPGGGAEVVERRSERQPYSAEQTEAF